MRWIEITKACCVKTDIERCFRWQARTGCDQKAQALGRKATPCRRDHERERSDIEVMSNPLDKWLRDVSGVKSNVAEQLSRVRDHMTVSTVEALTLSPITERSDLEKSGS